MTFAPQPPHPDCPPAHGGCPCLCHRTPGMRHIVPCCTPIGDEECIEPAAYDDPVTAGHCSTCGDTGVVNTFQPGPLARETGDMEHHPGPCPTCTCRPDDAPPDVVSPGCPTHDPNPEGPQG